MPQFVSPYFAAVDLGSNSFHMSIARVGQDTIDTVDRVKEMVQIARGMRGGAIALDAEERALACLARFAERLRDIPSSQVRAVGTKSLRSAKDARKFLRKAETVLGHPIAIISGYEEARLVYSGLSHSVASDSKRRLVVDIGGASTEFIVGLNSEPELLESLSFGCVVFTERYDLKKVTAKNMSAAYLAACSEMEQIRATYLQKGWDVTFGTSGTMRAVAELLVPSDGGALLSAKSVKHLYEQVINDSETTLEHVPALRRDVLPAGIAILRAIFDTLKLEKVLVADATLKEGLIYDTIGRLSDVDARHGAVARLEKQYHVDTRQGARVAACAERFWRQIDAPVLAGVSRSKMLVWGAKLHEIGLGISHSSHHHHGYYILRHSDLAGFGRYEQHILACLVRTHRKKLSSDRFVELDEKAQSAIIPLVVCLRLAVLLYRRREPLDELPVLSGADNHYVLTFRSGWLSDNPLTAASLAEEANQQDNLGISLKIAETP